MKKNNDKTIVFVFQIGDWVSTTEIAPNPGQKYTAACVKKTKHGGKSLFVSYGAYKDEKWITAISCKLIKRI